MKTYLIDFSEYYARDKKRVLNKLLWYDIDNKVMLTFLGDQMRFEWDFKRKKMLPAAKWSNEHNCYVMKDEIFQVDYQKRNNKQEVEDWVDNIGKRLGAEINDLESNNRQLAIDVDNSVSSQIEYALERQGFRFEEI